MSATTNIGNQEISFIYKEEATSANFNKLLYGLIPDGIYSGGFITKASDTSILLSPFILFFKDITNNLAVRIRTTTAISLDVSILTIFIIGRYSWLNAENNFLDIQAVSFADIQANDIIFGRLIYSGTSLSTTIDYTRKNWAASYYLNQMDTSPAFKIIANEPYDSKVSILPGTKIVNGVTITNSSIIQSPTFSLPVSTNGRKDILCIDKTGSFIILQGADIAGAPIPTIPSKYFPICLVTFPSSATVIQGSYIDYYNPLLFSSGQINGTSNTSFQIDQDNNGATLVSNNGALEIRDEGNNYIVVRGANPVGDQDFVTKGFLNNNTSYNAMHIGALDVASPITLPSTGVQVVSAGSAFYLTRSDTTQGISGAAWAAYFTFYSVVSGSIRISLDGNASTINGVNLYARILKNESVIASYLSNSSFSPGGVWITKTIDTTIAVSDMISIQFQNSQSGGISSIRNLRITISQAPIIISSTEYTKMMQQYLLYSRG